MCRLGRVVLALVMSMLVGVVVFRWLRRRAQWSGISPDKQARIRAERRDTKEKQ